MAVIEIYFSKVSKKRIPNIILLLTKYFENEFNDLPDEYGHLKNFIVFYTSKHVITPWKILTGYSNSLSSNNKNSQKMKFSSFTFFYHRSEIESHRNECIWMDIPLK